MNFKNLINKIASTSEPNNAADFDPLRPELSVQWNPSEDELYQNNIGETVDVEQPNWWDKNKNTVKTVGYTAGGGLTGAVLGKLIQGEEGSNLWPILLGLIGAGSGYAAANPDQLKGLYNSIVNRG